MNGSQLIFHAAALAVAAAVGTAAYAVAGTQPAPAPRLGRRGLKRYRARAASRGFAALEGWIRFLAALIARLPLGGVRRSLDRRLGAAGDYLGLTADEYLALSILSGMAGFAGGMAIGGAELLPMIAGACIGLVLPRYLVSAEITRRQREIGRGLPGAIDLAALCLGAGLDFPGALRQIAGDMRVRDALHEELEMILSELELGHTRRSALQSFADRVDTEEVRDFVAAVIQAEERGNPLAEVLRIQAEVLRRRRTIRGEEAAARASVLMIVPMILLIASVMTLILAPLLIRSTAAFTGG
jgi:tight adherence protein C